jgi:hypothetical protein|tara:strand:+ start:4840 stop:5778 length:939 start_codon:yes stop_codon:yes gene_type:complete
MYKKRSNLNLDNVALSITNTLCDMVQREPFTGSFNNFEVTIENEIPKIFWETSIIESQQPRLISSDSIQGNLETYSIYSSSLNLDSASVEVSNISSESLHLLENNLHDETILCVGYASTGSEQGYYNQEHNTAIQLGNYLQAFDSNFKEIDVSINNDIVDSNILTYSSSIDTSLIQNYCNSVSLTTGLINVINISNKNDFSSKKNHSYTMYGKGIGGDTINMYGKTRDFVSNYGNQLARKLAINEIKEKSVHESIVEILFVKGDDIPKYIKISNDKNISYKDTTLFTKEYIFNTYGITRILSDIFNDSNYFK